MLEEHAMSLVSPELAPYCTVYDILIHMLSIHISYRCSSVFHGVSRVTSGARRERYANQQHCGIMGLQSQMPLSANIPVTASLTIYVPASYVAASEFSCRVKQAFLILTLTLGLFVYNGT